MNRSKGPAGEWLFHTWSIFPRDEFYETLQHIMGNERYWESECRRVHVWCGGRLYEGNGGRICAGCDEYVIESHIAFSWSNPRRLKDE